MIKQGHPHSSNQCEGKMDRLMDDYKLHEERRGVTGNNVNEFAYEEDMRKLMGHWVNVHPTSLISFGSVSKSVHR